MQVFCLILIEKFSREFCRYIAYQQLLVRCLAENSLENSVTTYNGNNCKCIYWGMILGNMAVWV